MSWSDRVAERNEAVRLAGRWRSIRTLESSEPRTTTSDGREVVEFASNDYLGLSRHPQVLAAAVDAIGRYGSGSGAARLIVGGRPVHDELESALAVHYDREAALLFPTGYQANLGVITALAAAAAGDPAGPPIVYSDELNHASIIDGARLARADVTVYPHGDVDALAALLAASDRPALVVTDSVFSMDGDDAPLARLADLCRRHDALLVIDEAHSVLAPPPPADAVVVGTLSKTLGALGGFVAGPQSVIDLCRNTARSFIFTTASAPADSAAALAALQVLDSDEGAELVARLRSNLAIVSRSASAPIVPVLVGSEDRALATTDALLAEGLLVPAIRPPTVPAGTCRLRIAISAAHDAEDLHRLSDALDRLGLAP